MLKVLNIEALNERAKEPRKNAYGKIRGPVVRAKNIVKILERDNYQCVECGSKVNLTIDHTKGRKLAKHNNEQKNKIDKCQTLCEECHMKKNKK